MNIESIKSQCNALYLLPWELYKEQIVIFQTPVETQISSGPNFNFFYGENSPDTSVSYVTQSGVFFATVEYLDDKTAQEIGYHPDDNPAKVLEVLVRITVTGDAKAYLDKIEKVVFDGINFRVVSDVRHRGPFARQFYDYFLKKIEP